MKLLTCIRLPADILNALHEDQRRLKQYTLSGSFSEDNELFIPLNNLGETDLTAGAKVIIDRVSIPKFTLGIGGFGGSKKFGGDSYREAVELCEELLDLQRQLQVGFMTAEYKIDTAPYKPFVTLCKDCKMKPGFNPAEFMKTVAFKDFTVERVSLVRCDRVDGKYLYSELCSRELPDAEE